MLRRSPSPLAKPRCHRAASRRVYRKASHGYKKEEGRPAHLIPTFFSSALTGSASPSRSFLGWFPVSIHFVSTICDTGLSEYLTVNFRSSSVALNEMLFKLYFFLAGLFVTALAAPLTSRQETISNVVCSKDACVLMFFLSHLL